MKFVCIGYYDEARWNALPESEQNTLMDACFAFDDELSRNGHFAGGEGLQSADKAVTLRLRGGKVSATDGPFAETKEQIGGILMLEARNLEHAVQLMSRHPGVRVGPFEIRAVENMAPIVETSRARRGQATG